MCPLLEKASCIAIHKVFLCRKTGNFSKEGKLKILNNKRAYRLVCISEVPEDLQKIGSRDSKEKGQKCPESQRAYIKNNKRRKRQKSKNFKKGQECPESNKTFSNIRTQSIRKAKSPPIGPPVGPPYTIIQFFFACCLGFSWFHQRILLEYSLLCGICLGFRLMSKLK